MDGWNWSNDQMSLKPPGFSTIRPNRSGRGGRATGGQLFLTSENPRRGRLNVLFLVALWTAGKIKITLKRTDWGMSVLMEEKTINLFCTFRSNGFQFNVAEPMIRRDMKPNERWGEKCYQTTSIEWKTSSKQVGGDEHIDSIIDRKTFFRKARNNMPVECDTSWIINRQRPE